MQLIYSKYTSSMQPVHLSPLHVLCCIEITNTASKNKCVLRLQMTKWVERFVSIRGIRCICYIISSAGAYKLYAR